jgi:chemotaxis family two-component system sensor kinase Cph1
LTFRGEPGLVVSADGERLYQVISNIVGNALKFTAEGGIVDVLAMPDPNPESGLVRFAIADNGSGMPPDQLGHIFERYWRVRDANPTGSGLGLYIASGIVQAHGGRIWAESEVGVGSTFCFTLLRA